MKLRIGLVAIALGFSPSIGSSQVTPDMATGLSPYATYSPSEIDNVNPVNGNIFLKIPLVSFPQKGGKLRLDYYIFYNDKQWQANLYPYMPPSLGGGISAIYGQWTPAGITQSYSMPTLSAFGVYVARDQFVSYSSNTSAAFSQTFGLAGSEDSYTETTQYLTESATTPDGATHYLGDGVVETVTCGPLVSACPLAPTQGNGYIINQYPATDASGYDQFGHDPDGITYGSNSGIQITNFPNLAVKDPNGNQITTSASGWTDTYNRSIPGAMSNPGFEQFPNAANNFAPVSMGDLVPGVPGSIPPQCEGASLARTWQVPASELYGGTATYYLCYTYLNFQTAFNLSGVLPAQTYPYSVSEGSSSNGMGQALLLTSVVLPDKNSYTFTYDPQYLSLTTIGLPTGGSISYTWQNILFYPYPYVNSGSTGNWAGMVTPISRALATRTVTPGNGQPAITTQYHWFITSNAPGGGQYSDGGVQFPAYSVVTDSNDNDTEYTLGGNDDNGTFWPSYVITAVASYAGCSPHHSSCNGGTGTRLKSVSYALTSTTSGGASPSSPAFVPQDFTIPPSKITQTTTHLPSTGGDMLSKVVNTLVPNYGSCTIYSYPVWGASSVPTIPSSTSTPCSSTSQFASTSFYDFGSPGSGQVGALLKTESTQYAWQSLASYLNANLLNLVSKDVVMDSNGNWAAETDYGYDASPSPLGAHGNQTSVSNYTSSSSKLTSQAQYNSSGVMTLAIDPNLNEISYSSFLCSGSLPQIVTKAYGSTTTTPETTTYSYDCNIGKVLTVQDPNTKTTTYTYSDPLSRVNSVSYPDGGGETVQYSDVTSPNTFPLTMKVTTLTGETAGNRVETTTYDGLARKTETQVQTSTAGPTIITTTNYDNIGRVLDVSNPYYSTGDPTYGITTFSYDALSRKTKQVDSDGINSQTWQYNGPTVTFTDENANQWNRTTDGLGRLISVLEPNGASQTPSMTTLYSYSALGDLLSVAQLGGPTSTGITRNRTFNYDAASRLLCSSNPENSSAACPAVGGGAYVTGTMGYGYDFNGNITSRTDARGITTSYTYDALNRMLTKSYSDTVTPFSCFQYDGPTVANLAGRLKAEWTLPGSLSGGCTSTPPTTGFLTMRTILAYDPMGRVLSEQQCTPNASGLGSCTTSSPNPFALSYVYDLAGNTTAYTNGVSNVPVVGSINFGLQYDGAGRLQNLVSSWNPSAGSSGGPFALFTADPSNGYTATGAIQNMLLGNNIFVNKTYDNRLRATGETATHP